MSALKPIENRNVRGVAAESYPSNLICAHPECTEKVTLRPSGEPTVHHIFPRSQTKSKSYFVAIHEAQPPPVDEIVTIIPHAVGLCGSGTTGHHGDVEEHRAWIKLEDGEFVWYDRHDGGWTSDGDKEPSTWERLGPLNPQPGSREGKTKHRKRLKGDARRKRKTISLRVPDDSENGADLFDEYVEIVKEQLIEEGLYSEGDLIPVYEAVMAGLYGFIVSVGRVR